MTIRAHYRINFNMMNSDAVDNALSEFLKSAAAKRTRKRFFAFMGVLMLCKLLCCLKDLAAENTLEIVHWNHFLRIHFFHLFSGTHERHYILQIDTNF